MFSFLICALWKAHRTSSRQGNVLDLIREQQVGLGPEQDVVATAHDDEGKTKENIPLISSIFFFPQLMDIDGEHAFLQAR